MKTFKQIFREAMSWGLKAAGILIGLVLAITLLQLSGIGEWDKQDELNCYRKLEKAQCEILYPEK